MITINIEVDTASAKWKNAFPKMKRKIEYAAAAAFMFARKPASFQGRTLDISITLTTDARVRKLNRDYLGKDKPTNVLSFPQLALAGKARTKLPRDKALPLALGDIVLAFETTRREAKEQDKKLEAHTLHLVVHGMLHILGYDHMNDRDANSMEKTERDILAAMGYDDPYHGTIPDTDAKPQKKKPAVKKTAAIKKAPAKARAGSKTRTGT